MKLPTCKWLSLGWWVGARHTCGGMSFLGPPTFQSDATKTNMPLGYPSNNEHWQVNFNMFWQKCHICHMCESPFCCSPCSTWLHSRTTGHTTVIIYLPYLIVKWHPLKNVWLNIKAKINFHAHISIFFFTVIFIIMTSSDNMDPTNHTVSFCVDFVFTRS